MQLNHTSVDLHQGHIPDAHQLADLTTASYSAAVEQIQKRLAAPHEYLTNTPGIGNSIELVHAGTLFSEGAVCAGEVHPVVEHYLQERVQAGIDTLYVVGVWKPGGFSRLVMPHFAKEWGGQPDPDHVGPSVFSIAELVPNEAIGSWENLEIVTRFAKTIGLTLVLDFVPNTTGLGSDIIRIHPEYVRDFERPADEFQSLLEYAEFCETNEKRVFLNTYADACAEHTVQHTLSIYSVDGSEELLRYTRSEADEVYTAFLVRSMQAGFRPYAWIEIARPEQTTQYCKQLGTDGYTAWADVLMLETNSPAVQQLQAEFIARVASVTSVVRADMSHLPLREYWSHIAERVEALGVRMPEVWGEAYGSGVHDELAQRNVHSYANFLREWLTRDAINVPVLMHQLFTDSSAVTFYKRGMSVGYIANHDDDLGNDLLLAGAAATILCSLPVTKVLWAQGQLHGDTRRYGADQHVPMRDYRALSAEARMQDPAYVAHMDRLCALANRDVFRSAEAEWSPAVITTLQNRELQRIFHVTRMLGTERVLTVVDCQAAATDAIIEIDTAATFRIPREALGAYVLVDLLSGEVCAAPDILRITPDPAGPGYHSAMYSLTEKELLTAV